jgi:GNAT superfamily N-acetyltransferase
MEGCDMHLEPFDPASPVHIAAVASIWNAACGPGLAITEWAVRFNTSSYMGGTVAGRMAIARGEPIGFILASTPPNDPRAARPGLGWIDAMAVRPGDQRNGIGSSLLAWAEDWLSANGCTRFMIGGSLHTFMAGLPAELGTGAFFRQHGYQPPSGYERAWDVARTLHDYTTPPTAQRGLKVEVRPAEPGQEDAVISWLGREFPGRWHLESREIVRLGMRFSDYTLLWSERGIDGLCLLTFEDSDRPLDRYFPNRLPKPWGQLGTVGVSADRRGTGYGAALMDGCLRRLRDRGVAGCVIDWTSIVDFYGKFGFKPYREYLMFAKACS